MEKLSKAVAEIETIERVSLVPKDEAIRSLNEHLGLKDKAVKHNPLPDILIATVSSSTSPAGVDAAAGRIEKIEGVDMLAYETDWREKLDALSNVLASSASASSCSRSSCWLSPPPSGSRLFPFSRR